MGCSGILSGVVLMFVVFSECCVFLLPLNADC